MVESGNQSLKRIAKGTGEFAVAHGLLFALLRFIPLVALAGLLPTFRIFASWAATMSLAMIVYILLFLLQILVIFALPSSINHIYFSMERVEIG